MNPAPSSLDSLSAIVRRIGGDTVWLRVGRLFDGHESRGVSHLVFNRQNIRHVGDTPAAALVRPGQTSPDLDLPDCTVLPGLVEAHAHLFLEGGELAPERRADQLKLDDDELFARAEFRLERLLRLGIVAVRDAGDRNGVGLRLQRRCRSAERGAMPCVDSPGAAIHHQGRYGSFMATPLEDQGGIEAAVAARIAQGAHHIKLLATGIINFEKGAVTARPQMPAEELTRAVAASRAQGRQTMVHCSGHDGVDNCIAARVDTIEHAYFVDRDQLALMRDLDIAWVPTLAPVQFQLDRADILGWSETVRANLQRILEAHAARLSDAADLGVRIVAGSDAGSHGVAHGHGFLRELELMEQAGLSAERVLRSATGDASARLHPSEPAGVIAPGCPARFILTEAPVLQSVRHLRAPAVVCFDGVILSGGDDPGQPGM
ncbi:MAG: amidohydrolase family protein [Opitutaceae bacterium]|nr:amidohydrolase family protein [Opitutaceae bacterium]